MAGKWRGECAVNEELTKLNCEFDLEPDMACPTEAKERMAKVLEACVPLRKFAANIRAADTVSRFNRVLEAIFDEADAKRIWCGLPG